MNTIFIYLKKTICLSILLLATSCVKQDSEAIPVDLSKDKQHLLYSSFVEKLDYIHINTGKECLLSGIKKIYFDHDTIIIHDTKSEGIFAFTTTGNLVSHINYKGQGPEEFLDDNAIAVDTLNNFIYVYDMMNFKINAYTYKGAFAFSEKIDYFMRDFSLSDNKLVAFQPCINQAYKKNGVWVYDFITQKETTLLEHDEDNQLFEFMATYTKQIKDTIYYYDRNNDYIYVIKNDSISTLAKIKLKQAIPTNVREIASPNPNELNQKAMMFDFCPSSKQVILSYFIFGEEKNPYRYVLIDPTTKVCSVFSGLMNDMDSYQISDPKIFCINGNTWCRMIEQEENSEIITLQILHLRN